MRYGEWGKHIELFDRFEAFRRNPKVLEAAAAGTLAGMSGPLQEGSGSPEGRVDFPIFLQTVVRHRLRERFKTVESRYDSYVGFESARDFREHTVSSLGAIRGFGGVGEHGEYPRLQSSEEEGPPFSVAKWGGIYAVTYELVINDETDRILNRIPGELGRSAGEYIAQVIVAFIESNPTYPVDGKAFFHSSRGNIRTGAEAEPTETNLMAALDQMTLRRDADNIPIQITPRRIIVRNPSLKRKFDAMIRSQLTGVRADVSGAEAPAFAPGTDNPVYNVLPPDATIEENWLNDPQDWYITADANERPPFVQAYLRGQRMPSIFLKDSGMRGLGGGGADPYSMDFDEVPYKLRHVSGTACGEPYAAMKMQP